MSWNPFGRLSPTIDPQSPRDSRSSVEAILTSGARPSKFPGLKGFVAQNDNTALDLDYTYGQTVSYAEVGRVFFINHQQDEELNHRVVVIWRTNRDSWSCYGFCKHDNKYDCENIEFQDDHIKVIAISSATRQTNTTLAVANTSVTRQTNAKPVVAVDLRNAKQEPLELESNIWINCREMLDIKHTVWLAPLGRVAPEYLEQLWDRGEDVFRRTFANRDKVQRSPSSRSTISKSHSPPQTTRLEVPPSHSGAGHGRGSRRKLSNDIWNLGGNKRQK